MTVTNEPDTYPVDVQYELTNDNIEVTDIRMTDTSVLFTVKPLSMGESGIDMMIDIEGQAEPLPFFQRITAGPLGTIFVCDPFFDFNGSFYVVLLIILCLLAVTVVTLVSFFDYLKKSDYSYPMVACGGIVSACSISFSTFSVSWNSETNL